MAKQVSSWTVYYGSRWDTLVFERVNERDARKLAASGRGVYFFPCKPAKARVHAYVSGNMSARAWKEMVDSWRDKFADAGQDYNVQYWKLCRFVLDPVKHWADVPENPEEWGYREFARVMRCLMRQYDDVVDVLLHPGKFAETYDATFFDNERRCYSRLAWYLKQVSRRFPDYWRKWEIAEGRTLEFYNML